MQKNKKVKTILVTGGAGFIGSHLCKCLVRDGYTVISLDNYFTGTKKNHIEGVEYIGGNTKDIEKHISAIPDLVYHLGEYARVERSFKDIELVWDYNIHGTFAVLEFCRKLNTKLVYAGSSTKFGDGGLGRDQSPYAWAKASNTELVRNYGLWYDLDYAITYFYNVYGPREISAGSYATVIGIFKDQFKSGRPLTVVSPGTQLRNFTYIDDIVRGLMLVGERGHGDEYGLGSKEKYSILDIAKMFNTDIVMLPERKGNRMSSDIDLTKSRALGWHVERGVQDYIQEIIAGKRNER